MDRLNDHIVRCDQCPRLRAYCRQVARTKRASYRDQTYFGRPVPNFGDPRAGLLVIGLAPAAHGANRTGRMFTGDRSGDWLYQAMYDTGFCNQPTALAADDGLVLTGAMITAAVHCAPPGNRPTGQELARCAGWLDQTFALLTELRVVVCLGRVAFTTALRHYRQQGWVRKLADHPFSHGQEHVLRDGTVMEEQGHVEIPIKGGPQPDRHHPLQPPVILCSYHPSQQNTFTGRLTRSMLLAVFSRARVIIDQPT